MPTSAIGGLVEGLLQGQAIKQQKQQDRLNQERQHATDIFNQHVQTWRETQAQEEAKRTAEQQKFDNEISTKRQANAEAEEARKVAADKQKQILTDAVLNAKTDKQRQDAFLKLYLQGGETQGNAAQLAGMIGGGQQAQPQQGALQGALNTLGSAGQGQAPIPNAGPLQQAPGSQPLSPIEELMQGKIPTADRIRATPQNPNAGAVSPMTAAKIKNTEAGTQNKIANTALLGDKDVYEQMRIAFSKQAELLEKAKTDKTKAEIESINAFRNPKLELLDAQTELFNVKKDAAIAQTELTHARTQWLPVTESIKRDSLNLRKENDAFRRQKAEENLGLRATGAKTQLKNERDKATTEYHKLDNQRIYWEGFAHLDPTKIDPTKGAKVLQQHDMAPDILKGLQVQMEQKRAHINELSAQGAHIDNIIADTSTRTTGTGATDKKLTDADRKAAADAAKRPPTLPPTRINIPGQDASGQPTWQSPPPLRTQGNKLPTGKGLKPIKKKDVRPIIQGQGFTLTPK